MYIRDRDEALDALSAVLDLPERRDQIIQITVCVAVCLDADARSFLADSAAGLIHGGLEYMRNKRREMLEVAADGGEAILIVDSSEDQLIEAVGSAMDAMRLAEVVAEVFPELAGKHESWEIGRAVLGDEQSIRQALVAAVKERKKEQTDVRMAMERRVADRIAAARPPWFESAALIRKAVDADLIFNIVALDDMRAQLVLDLAAGEPAALKDYIDEIRLRVDRLAALEAEQK